MQTNIANVKQGGEPRATSRIRLAVLLLASSLVSLATTQEPRQEFGGLWLEEHPQSGAPLASASSRTTTKLPCI